jgi:RNA polymerase sigma factor (sigma-70 family)
MKESTRREAAELQALYGRLSSRLQAIVARNVAAPDYVVEDACQVAWSRLHFRRAEVRAGCELGWLCTTARREAVRMMRAGGEETSLQAPEETARVIALPAAGPGPDGLAELRDRLADIRALPPRQRRMLWLQAIGYDYGEIAERTGDSRRTVERQLLRARQRLAGCAGGSSGPAKASAAG